METRGEQRVRRKGQEMRLRALKDVSSICGIIPAGSEFHELDDELALGMIARGEAEPWIKQQVDARVRAHTVDLLSETKAPEPEPVVETKASEPEPPAPTGFPLDWQGCTVVVMASGPSFSMEQ